jgi:acyl-CoA synthetase (AMP-forming)/AMP-acid ligase II
LTPDALRERCAKALASYKVPREFVITTELLPRTASGKVQKFKARERFGG